MARASRRPAEPQTTGELAFASAVDLMYQRGFHGTSLRDVARAVGVQMSTLYYYFPSKQDLLMSIMTSAMQEMTVRVQAAVGLAEGATGMLKAAVRAHILFHADQLKEAVVADTELRSLEDEGRAQVVAMRDAYEQIFRDIIEEGQRTGEFRDVDAHLATRALLGAITDVANWFRPRGGLSLDEISDQYCSVFLQGISNPTPKPNRKKPSR